MTPRIFVSSTYYDLRHVRERIEKFIRNYGFEPVLFESDKVTYEHGKPIDVSAYTEVSLCHVMILIIGGRYGMVSSIKNDIHELNQKYEDGFVSITRKELETALEKNIPIFIFIDKNVYSEYQTYTENIELLSDTKYQFKFAHVDNKKIFQFIDLIKSKPLKTFEKVDEIEQYLKSQFSGFFYLYLESLKQTSDNNKILDTITELNSITRKMDEMLKSVGKKVLSKDKEEYESVIKKQLEIIIETFVTKVFNDIEIQESLPDSELDKINFTKIADYFVDNIFEHEDIKNHFNNINTSIDYWDKNEIEKTKNKINVYLKKQNEKLEIKNLKIHSIISEYYRNLKPFLNSTENIKLFKDELASILCLRFDEIFD